MAYAIVLGMTTAVMKSKNPFNQPINTYFLALVVNGEDIEYARMDQLEALRAKARTIPGAAIKRRSARSETFKLTTDK